MMRKLFHVAADDSAQLHCDNPACRHVLAKGAQQWGPHLIGFPCPKCGSNMLTVADYERLERFARRIEWLNKWFGWLGSKPPAPGAGVDISIRLPPEGVEININRDRSPITFKSEGLL